MIFPRGTTVDPPLPAFRAARRETRRSLRALSRGFTLLELLIVILLLSILAELAITSIQSTVYDQLRSTAGIIAGQLDYARSLALANNSRYRIEIDVPDNQLVLTHSGADSAFNTLPTTAFHTSSDQPHQQVLPLGELPNLSILVELLGAQAAGTPPQNVADVEFGPLGETTRSAETTIWLTAGFDTARRYMPIRVNPVTGLTTIGDMQGELPTGLD